MLLAGALAGTARADGPSEAGAIFLKLVPDAVSAGMGETGVARWDNPAAVWWNPGALGFQTRIEGYYANTDLLPSFNLPDLYHRYAAAVYPVPAWGATLGGHFIYTSYGTTESRNENNNPAGTFHSYELAAAVAGGARVHPDLGVGLAFKYLGSHLSPQSTAGNKTSQGWAADLGALYRPGWMQGLGLGATLTNIGPSLDYGIGPEKPLPQNLRLGLSCDVFAALAGLAGANLEAEPFIMGWVVNAEFDKELVDLREDRSPRPFYQALFTAWSDDDPQNEKDGIIRHVGMEAWGKLRATPDLLLRAAVRSGTYYDILGDRNPSSQGFSLGADFSTPGLDFWYRFDYAQLSAAHDNPLDKQETYGLVLGLQLK
ncbi:MAG: hypothetical protein C4524_08070 [Candidatus Zixiibacteriota bacterium]|nr:MAG: hypothetical protein C4524_08070 [candidate division Zixibacteria bacterium]